MLNKLMPLAEIVALNEARTDGEWKAVKLETGPYPARSQQQTFWIVTSDGYTLINREPDDGNACVEEKDDAIFIAAAPRIAETAIALYAENERIKQLAGSAMAILSNSLHRTYEPPCAHMKYIECARDQLEKALSGEVEK